MGEAKEKNIKTFLLAKLSFSQASFSFLPAHLLLSLGSQASLAH